uniref:Uncharacterized protein n=1 Tax=Glossina palpalis gambiensis TaxID=67801 RepID=A0A1B0BK41_9MUSC
MPMDYRLISAILTYSSLRLWSWNYSHRKTTRKTVSGFQGGVGDNLQNSLERTVKTVRSVNLCLCSDLPFIPDHKSTYSSLWISIDTTNSHIFTLGVLRSQMCLRHTCYDVFIMFVYHVIALINMILKRIIKYFACLRPYYVCISYVILK